MVVASDTRVADELAIRNLVARVAQLADMGPDLDVYATLFTEDATWEFPGSGRQDLPPVVRAGRAEIVADRQERRSTGFQGPGTNTRHVVTTLAVAVDGSDTASAQSYWLYFVNTTTAPAVGSMGHYHDTLVRTPEGWKVSRRKITVG